LYLIVKKI